MKKPSILKIAIGPQDIIMSSSAKGKRAPSTFGFSSQEVQTYELKRESGNLSVSDMDSHFTNMSGSLPSSSALPQGIQRNASDRSPASYSGTDEISDPVAHMDADHGSD